MRLKIELKPNDSNNFFIPFNYNQYIHAMILQKINLIDPNYATELHDSKLFKFFTFSEFFIKKAKANKQGFNVFSETVSLFVASPNLKFMETFMSGIIYDPVVMIKSTKLELSDIKIIKDPEFTHFLQIKTISPVLITTIKEKENKKVVWDLLPQEDKFYENICKNIYKKWTTFYGYEPSTKNLELKIISEVKTRRIKIKNEYHVASLFNGVLKGSPELLGFAYNTGLGQKNSMGFGMLNKVS